MTFGLLMLLANCTASGPGNECAGWKALHMDAASIDGLTERDAAAVLAHNRFGRALGCWK